MNEDQLLEYRGPLAPLFRPIDRATFDSIALSTAALSFLAGLASLPFAFGLSEVAVESEVAIGVVAAISALIFTPTFLLIRRLRTDTLAALLPYVAAGALVTSVLVLSASVYLVGPHFTLSVYFIEPTMIGFFILRRRFAVGLALLATAAYSGALFAQGDPVAPVEQVLALVTAAVATAVLIGGLAKRLDESRAAVIAVNRRLRRFLAHQVADAVTAEHELAPHRSTIAAVFVDLRGFTAFTNASTPERVVEVLAEFYAVVGPIVDRYDGTIGGLDGDGVFAFVGDPLPNENAAADALTMAKEIANALDVRATEWGVGYGIGLAYGEATVGLVGYEGRLDYTPIGACVNLAARLCSDAKPGEIVIDDALRAASGVADARRRADVELKGFGVTPTYTVEH